VLEPYLWTPSHVNFATLVVQNARLLELMEFLVDRPLLAIGKSSIERKKKTRSAGEGAPTGLYITKEKL
jgi:hypothetical protein